MKGPDVSDVIKMLQDVAFTNPQDTRGGVAPPQQQQRPAMATSIDVASNASGDAPEELADDPSLSALLSDGETNNATSQSGRGGGPAKRGGKGSRGGRGGGRKKAAMVIE